MCGTCGGDHVVHNLTRLMMLLELPDHLITSILVFWLEIEQVGRLDSAMCNQSLREQYVKIAYNNSQPYSTDSFVDFTFRPGAKAASTFFERRWMNCIVWVLNRKAAVTGLVLESALPDTEVAALRSFLEMHGKHITLIDFSKYSYDNYFKNYEKSYEKTLNLLVAFCPNVQSIVFPPYCKHGHFDKMGSLWPSMQNVVITGGPSTENNLKALSAHCTQIKKMLVYPSNATAEEWSDFLRLSGSTLIQLALVHGFQHDPHPQSMILTIAEHCPKLQSLCARIMCVSADCIRALVVECPALHVLALYGCSLHADHVAVLAQVGTRLSSLDITINQDLPDVCAVDMLARCPHLISLTLRGTGVTVAIAVAVGQHCHRLKNLDISAVLCWSHSLRSIAEGCPALEQMSFSRTDVDGAGLMELMTRCHRLTHLSLWDCKGITDASLLLLPQLLPGLVELNVFGASVTVTGVSAVLEGGRKLKRLTVLGNIAQLIEEKGLTRPGLRVRRWYP